MPVVVCPAIDSSYLEGEALAWALVWAAPNATNWVSGGWMSVGYDNTSFLPTLVIIRAGLLFDTHNIPIVATINSAILHLHTCINMNGDTFDGILQANPLRPSTPAVASDYDKSWYGSNDGVVHVIPGMAMNQDINITVPGLGHIKPGPGAITRWIMRADFDISNTPPVPAGLHYFQFAGTGLGNDPTLDVTYTMPVAAAHGGGSEPEDTEFLEFNQKEIVPLQEKLILTKGSILSGIDADNLIREIESKELLLVNTLNNLKKPLTRELELRKEKLQLLLGTLRRQRYMLMHARRKHSVVSGWTRLARIHKAKRYKR